MPIFLRNVGLQSLVGADGQLDDELLVQMMQHGRARKSVNSPLMYIVAPGESGVEFVYTVIPQGGELQVLGLDLHVGGPCIWKGYPFMKVIDEPSRLCIAFSNADQSAVFTADVLNAGVLPSIEAEVPIEMQVCAFPIRMQVYSSRGDYEAACKDSVVLQDGQPFPFNFIRDYAPDAQAKEPAGPPDLLMLCAPVLHVDCREGGMNVATVKTVFGHLDVVYNTDMLEGMTLAKGQYLSCTCVVSGDVALPGHENWMD